MITEGCRGLPGVTGVKLGYKGFFFSRYKGLQGVKGVTGGYRGYKGLQGVSRV